MLNRGYNVSFALIISLAGVVNATVAATISLKLFALDDDSLHMILTPLFTTLIANGAL